MNIKIFLMKQNRNFYLFFLYRLSICPCNGDVKIDIQSFYVENIYTCEENGLEFSHNLHLNTIMWFQNV